MSPDSMRQHAEVWRNAHTAMVHNLKIANDAIKRGDANRMSHSFELVCASAIAAMLGDFAAAMHNGYLEKAKELEASEI